MNPTDRLRAEQRLELRRAGSDAVRRDPARRAIVPCPFCPSWRYDGPDAHGPRLVDGVRVDCAGRPLSQRHPVSGRLEGIPDADR